MDFKQWLETKQLLFPFKTDDDPPNISKINKYKSLDNYVKSMSKGGRKTEISAKQVVSQPPGSAMAKWFGGGFELEELVPNAVVIPSFTFPNGYKRPQWNLAIAILKSKNVINPQNKEGNYKQFRILAFFQGQKSTFTKSEVMDPYANPVGGLVGFGDQITHVWVDDEYRGNLSHVNVPNLYKELLKFAKERGIVGMASENACCSKCGETVQIHNEPKKCPKCGTVVQPLTSKSFRAAQAKYDWKRTKGE
jgi:hypothetical protein